MRFLYHNSHRRELLLYLYICIMCVVSMVFIGGLTRLTGSGLSITEWKPITGVIPPFSEPEWIIEFEKYKISPEFIHINNQISLENFKFLYLVEFFHRIAARITGLIFLIPAIILWSKDMLPNRTKYTLTFVLIIGIFQGLMGWYMVKSGLKDSPYVSHFRLSFHLCLALIIYMLLVNEAVNTYLEQYKFSTLNYKWNIIIILLFLQIFLGGLVAGLDAGKIYNQFPLMGDGLVPTEFNILRTEEYLHNAASTQFFHRMLAVIIVMLIFFRCIKLFSKGYYFASMILFVSILAQFILGILTLINNVPIFYASMHQIFAFLLTGLVLIVAKNDCH
ncbi:MAG: COX15/CtaA family protein [Rickettsiaceae bacterium]|nr:COX15/CtaA family protein [Rickettsiaceae bacterium]